MSAAGDGNVFFQAGRALLTQLDKHEQAGDPTLLLAGSESEVEKRWACSAIKLKQDAGWLVVPKAGPVQMGDTRRVCARSDGKFTGRAKYYSLRWMQANADAVALGSLTLADGAGSRSTFGGGPTEDNTRLVAATDSTDGQYYVDLCEGASVESLELGAALGKVGAVFTPLGGPAADSDEVLEVVEL